MSNSKHTPRSNAEIRAAELQDYVCSKCGEFKRNSWKPHRCNPKVIDLKAFVESIEAQVRLIESGLNNIELTKARLTDLDAQAFDLLQKIGGES